MSVSRRSTRVATGWCRRCPKCSPPSRRTSHDPDKYPVDARGLVYSFAFIGIKRLGAGQFYLVSIKDKDGNAFDGGKTYRLTVPAERASRAVLVGDGV